MKKIKDSMYSEEYIAKVQRVGKGKKKATEGMEDLDNNADGMVDSGAAATAVDSSTAAAAVIAGVNATAAAAAQSLTNTGRPRRA